MPARKRKVAYPPARTGTKGGARAPDTRPERQVATAIDTTAAVGRKGLSIGDRVRIASAGLYSGEAAVIERFTGTAIPTAVVLTDAGNRRTVRTIDLVDLDTDPEGARPQ